MKKSLVLVLVILLSVVSVFANAGKENKAVKEQKTVLNIGINSNIVGLDPLNTNSSSSRAYSYAVFEPLVDYDHKGTSSNFVPCLATDWSVDSTGCVWTFKLRQGVTFHDGEAFTSKDVKCTYDRLIKEGSALNVKGSFWASLKACNIVDDYTVQIVMSEPYASTLVSVAMTPIIPDEAYAKYGENFWNNQILTGTGPWKFVEWVDGAYMHFKFNENYWNKDYNPNVKELYLRFLTEVSTAIASHVSGDLDAYIVNGGINNELLSMYAGNDHIELVKTETANWIFIGYHCKDGSAFEDIKCRQAVDYAIDRDLLIKAIYNGEAKKTNGIVQPSMPGYDTTIPMYEYNPEKAKKLLKESSYDGHQITLYTSNSLAKGKDQCLAIAEMLNAVGFNVVVEAVESAAFTNLRKAGDYEFFLMNDQPMGGDLAKYVTQKIVGDNHKHQLVGASEKALGNAILAELDPAKRAQLLNQLSRRQRELAGPTTMLYTLTQTQAINYGVVGFDQYEDTCYNFKYIDFNPALAK